MIKIKENKSKLETKPIDAIIENNTIIPGKKGKSINLNESYKNMKRINKYTESLYVYKYIKPNISLKNKYDKLIINGNKNTNNISILLKTNNLDFLKELVKNDSLNIILESNFINDNLEYLNTIKNNIIVLENNDLINLNIIDYCYTTTTFNSFCSVYNKYTIKPNFITSNYYYNTYKLINNGSILAYNIINENNINEINTIISYIKTLNYKIVSIDELITE